MTSVRELELELNVSKVSLYAILKKEQFKGHVVKGEKNVIMVDDEGADMLREYYLNKIRGGKPRSNGVYDDGQNGAALAEASNAEELGVISILQEQLAKKDEQIENLLNIVLSQAAEKSPAS